MPGLYIINPAASVPSYYTAESFASAEDRQGWVQVADLTTATVAALVPSDWDVTLTDESISPVDLHSDADFIALTGKVSQRSRMFALADEFRRRGKVVLIGGSFASLTPHDVRPHADILITGELEEIAPTLFSDLAAGHWQDHYEGGRADISKSPIPRWDLYPVGRALSGAVQTTRGCPFSCEFCDVIQYQGRKQRHKTVNQVLTELDALRQAGFLQVFIADDNFTVHRRHANSLLDAIIEWNGRNPEPIRFMAQASLDVARDQELLRKCRAAGIRILFLGVETVNADSLRETGKRQNLLLPVDEAISRILQEGIAVQAGIIFGFDHDNEATLKQLQDFFSRSAIPDLGIGPLVAPPATDLYRRLADEGRLQGDIWESAAGLFQTNILPKQMSQKQLLDGVLMLCRAAYHPREYSRRMLRFIEQCKSGLPHSRAVLRAPENKDRANLVLRCVQEIAALGRPEETMIGEVLRAAVHKADVLPTVLHFLSRYRQMRFFLDRVSAGSTATAI